MKYCKRASKVIINDDGIIAEYPDITIVITHDPDYFIGWLTPLSIPEYFMLGISPDLFTVIWPNG